LESKPIQINKDDIETKPMPLVRPFARRINFVKNGGFEQTQHDTPFTGEIAAWENEGVELGPGKLYNNKWTSQVVRIGDDANQVLRQTIDLAPGVYDLAFTWTNFKGNKAQGEFEVFWNNKLVASMIGVGRKIQTETIRVKPCPCCGGRNVLEFRAPLDTKGASLTIDDVSLFEVVQNGNQLESIAPEREI